MILRLLDRDGVLVVGVVQSLNRSRERRVLHRIVLDEVFVDIGVCCTR
jgi:hypothetical protein